MAHLGKNMDKGGRHRENREKEKQEKDMTCDFVVGNGIESRGFSYSAANHKDLAS